MCIFMEEKSIMRLLEYEDTSKLLFQKANELLHDQNNVDMIEKLKTLINALANVSKLFQCQEKETLLRTITFIESTLFFKGK